MLFVVMILKQEVLKYERFRNTRIDRELTQQQIAQYLHVSQNTYSQYETGVLNYPLDVAVALATFYHISLDYLVGLTDNPNRSE